MVKAKKYVLTKHFRGEPKKTDLVIVEEELPEIKPGEFLCKAEYLSVDPYMRIFMDDYPEGNQMIGTQVARIIKSKNEMFPENELVIGNYGWRDYTIDGGKNTKTLFMFVPTYIWPSFGTHPPSLGIGVLGMPGNTAYFALTKVCKPKVGETVVVSGAAGAVGSIAGQIAKIKGCTVIGLAGTDEKCDWLKSELGFDYAINYKTEDVAEVLKKVVPNGIDCYFDNVGGDLSKCIVKQMKKNGMILICGLISQYNKESKDIEEVSDFCDGKLKVVHFSVLKWTSKWMEGIEQLKIWINEGKIKYKETVTYGFDSMFEGFVGMLRGDNIGKAIVKV